MTPRKHKTHWEREKSGKMTKADYKHERREKFGHEVREHGLTIREAERLLLNAQRKKYARKPRSKFHIR
jgi:hypothetical protein